MRVESMLTIVTIDVVRLLIKFFIFEFDCEHRHLQNTSDNICSEAFVKKLSKIAPFQALQRKSCFFPSKKSSEEIFSTQKLEVSHFF